MRWTKSEKARKLFGGVGGGENHIFSDIGIIIEDLCKHEDMLKAIILLTKEIRKTIRKYKKSRKL